MLDDDHAMVGFNKGIKKENGFCKIFKKLVETGTSPFLKVFQIYKWISKGV
jgi:hypothetical protein